MTLHWSSFWIGFAFFPALTFVVALLAAAVMTALATNRGTGGCVVCDEAFTCEPGEHTRIGIWLRTRRHRWFIATRREHREAWANSRWNPYRAPGVPSDIGAAALRREKPNALRQFGQFLRY